jgi:DNA uptake protein ComE-like DNA-binding protein
VAERGSFVWTRRQRAVLASIVVIVCAAFFVQSLRHPKHVDDPPAPTGDLARALATRIDPNTADWPAWAGLPLIGEKRAKEIVAFREQWLIDHADELPFERPDDLTRVKGIGKATVEALKPYLIFPTPEPDSP